MMWICRRWTEYKRRTSGWIHVVYQAKIPGEDADKCFCQVALREVLLAAVKLYIKCDHRAGAII